MCVPSKHKHIYLHGQFAKEVTQTNCEHKFEDKQNAINNKINNFDSFPSVLLCPTKMIKIIYIL